MSAISQSNPSIQPAKAAGLPILGNALSFLGAKGVPIDFLRESALKHGDVVEFNVGPQRLYLLSHPDLVHEVLVKRVGDFHKAGIRKNQRRSLARFLGEGILTSNYEAWRPQRKLIQPLMHSKHINQYAETMVQFGEKLINRWDDGKVRNIHQDMMQVTMWIIAETMFGMDVTQTPELEALAHDAQEITVADLMSPLPTWLTKSRDRRAEEINDYLTKLVERFMAEHRSGKRENRHDLLSLLMDTRDEEGNPMSDGLVRDNILTLFFAGHETTANTLTWVFYYLDKNPQVLAKLHEELDRVLAGRNPSLEDLAKLPYTLKIIKETMRIEPTVAAFPRLIEEDTSIQNYQLKGDSTVLISPYVLHHDPRWWTNPDEFEPERFSEENEAKILKYAYLPFGGGPRVCIGNHFSLMESQILLAMMVSRYSLKLQAGAKVKPLRQVTASPENGLYMSLEKRFSESHGEG